MIASLLSLNIQFEDTSLPYDSIKWPCSSTTSGSILDTFLITAPNGVIITQRYKLDRRILAIQTQLKVIDIASQVWNKKKLCEPINGQQNFWERISVTVNNIFLHFHITFIPLKIFCQQSLENMWCCCWDTTRFELHVPSETVAVYCYIVRLSHDSNRIGCRWDT